MSKTPLYEIIASKILIYIKENHLMPGDRLPGGRKLAEILSTSRFTVYEALDLLQSEGFLNIQSSSGSYIMQNAWFDGDTGTPDWEHYTSYSLSRPASHILQKLVVNHSASDINMSSLHLHKEFGYHSMLQAAIIDILPDIMATDALNDTDAYGLRSVRTAVKKYLRKKAINVSEEDIVLAPNSDNAIEYVVKALTGEHKKAVIYTEKEFASILKVLFDKYNEDRLSIVGLDTDREGVVMDQVKNLPPANASTRSILMVNPPRQFIHHSAMSNRRKHHLVETCASLRMPLIEVDYFSDLTPTLHPIKSLDIRDGIIYIATLMSYAQTGIGVAWIVAPPVCHSQNPGCFHQRSP